MWGPRFESYSYKTLQKSKIKQNKKLWLGARKRNQWGGMHVLLVENLVSVTSTTWSKQSQERSSSTKPEVHVTTIGYYANKQTNKRNQNKTPHFSHSGNLRRNTGQPTKIHRYTGLWNENPGELLKHSRPRIILVLLILDTSKSHNTDSQ